MTRAVQLVFLNIPHATLFFAMDSERQETASGMFEGQFIHFGYFDDIHSPKKLFVAVSIVASPFASLSP